MSHSRPHLFDEVTDAVAGAGSATFPLFFSPSTIGKMELRDRFVFQPHFTALGDTDGNPSEDHAAYHAERARGGVGLIVFESQAVHPTGRMSGRFVTHIHLAGSNRLPPGEGEFPTLIETLKKTGFDAYLTVEIGFNRRDVDPDAFAKRAHDCIKAGCLMTFAAVEINRNRWERVTVCARSNA